MAPATRRDAGKAWSFTEPGQKINWPYQKWFNTHIARRTRYAVVREAVDRPLGEMIAREKDPARRQTLSQLEKARVPTLIAFLEHASTLAGAKALATRADLRPQALCDLLRHIYRRILPLGAQVRQLIDPADRQTLRHVETLKAHKLSFSLALLDAARTRQGRQQLAQTTGIPAAALLDLARRADLTRLWLMGGGMVRIAWALGYPGLRALQNADPDEYFDRCVAHYARIRGKPGDLTRENCHSHIARMRAARTVLEE